MTGKQTIILKLRLRDKHAAELNRQARAVNFVWNFCNETQQKAAKWGRKWLTGNDLQKLTAGSSKLLDLHSSTIDKVCLLYDQARFARKKPWLRWRGQRSLGWVPFGSNYVRFDGSRFKFRGSLYETMHLREALMPGMTFGMGSFNADSRGRWYLNIPVTVDCAVRSSTARVGIDLGLSRLATLSTGEKIEAPAFYRRGEAALAKSQRARKSKRARAIHAKIANRRHDFLHKLTAKLTKEYGLIVIGDVSPSKLAQTKMAKSIHDAGWSDLRRMLTYKSIRNGGSTLEVSERLTSQVCSECGSLPPSRPRGIADLGKRVWCCDDCGAEHDRDVNAARNILRLGLETLCPGAAL